MIVSFLYLGGAIGSTVGGTICDKTGRKKAILTTDITFIIGAIQLFVATSFIQVLLGRIVIGFAIAVSGIADVAYLHEISPVPWRGAIVSVNEACISLGFLISYLAGYSLSQLNPVHGWRYMFAMGSLIALIQFGGMVYMPESPVWLNDHGRKDEANAVMELINGSIAFGGTTCSSSSSLSAASYRAAIIDDENRRRSNAKVEHHVEHHVGLESNANGNGNANGEIHTIEDYGIGDSSSSNLTTITTTTNNNNNKTQQKEQYASFDVEFSSSNNNQNFTQQPNEPNDSNENIFQKLLASYRQVIIAIFLAVMQQFCGHPNVLNYAPEIFNEIGVPSLLSTLLVGVLKFCVTCYVILKIEQFGRRFLLLLGMSIIAVSLLLLTFAFSSQDEDGNLSKSAQITAVFGIFGVAGGYAASFGPLTWLFVSELFPSSIRGRALGLSTIITYLAGALVSYTFLSVQNWFEASVPFAIYFILTLISIGFAFVGIPDTAGKDPKSIQSDMETMWLWRSRQRREYTPNVITDSSHQVV